MKELTDYSIEEKIAFFDRCYNYAKDELEEYETEKVKPKGTEYHAWEIIMSLLAPEVWDRWNAIEPIAER